MKTFGKRVSIFVLPVLLVACNTKSDKVDGPSQEKVKVVAGAAKEVLFSEEVYATGRVTFKSEYKLSFKTSGIIERIPVKEGERVSRGQLLASLKLDEINAKAGQAENAVAKAERDFQRAKALYADSVATLEQLQNAESQLNHSRLDLKAAQFNLRYSQIRAPQDGVIQYINVSENEALQAGAPVLLFGSRSSAKALETHISDADVVKIVPGDSAFVLFDPYPEIIFQGAVREISGTADPSTGTYEIKIEINDPGNRLKSGFIGTANIVASQHKNYIELPVEALVSANGKSGVVYVFQGGTAKKRNIKIHQVKNDKLIVSEGIEPGEKVITEGLQNLSGDTVQVELREQIILKSKL
jgi:RND family efflux transporter MFP subunit